MSRVKDLRGRTFGKLEVLGPYRIDNRKASWQCRCCCGKITWPSSYALQCGLTASCGCQRRVTHGKSGTKLHRIWQSMRSRCYTKSDNSYKAYGARGITVHKDWDLFQNFSRDMGERPSASHTLERIDVDKDYSKENCEWISFEKQSRNKQCHKNPDVGIIQLPSGRFQARISFKNKGYHATTVDTIEEARQARTQLELKYWKQ